MNTKDLAYKRYRTHILLLANKIKEGNKINPVLEKQNIINIIQNEYQIRLSKRKLSDIDNAIINLIFWTA